jgi:hypothetical protein
MRVNYLETTMLILMDQILTDYADQAYEAARLRRNGARTAHDWVSTAVLTELEATGDAMRFVNGKGQIAWKATPQLRDYLMDVLRDTEDDLEDL